MHRAQRFCSGSYSNIGKSRPTAGATLLDELQVVSDLQAQRSQRIAHDLGRVGAEEDQIAVARSGALENSAIAASLRNFRIGDCNPSRPLASRSP